MCRKRFFVLLMFCIGFSSQLFFSMSSQIPLVQLRLTNEFLKQHSPSAQLQKALDRLFCCTSTSHKKNCSCKLMQFLKAICVDPFKKFVQNTSSIHLSQKKLVKDVFKWVKVLRLKPNDQSDGFDDMLETLVLDMMNVIFTFNSTILSNYVFSVRFPSTIWSPIVTKNKQVILGRNETINLSRVIGAKRVRTCIKKNRLRHAIVPDMYLYHIPGKPCELVDFNYIVISKRVKGMQNWDKLDLSQEVANELYQCVYETGIANPSLENLIATEVVNGVVKKVALIDTKCLPVGPDWYRTLWCARAFKYAYYSYPRWIANPYITSKKFTNDMVIKAHRKQAEAFDERYWIAKPDDPMQLDYNPFQEGMQLRRQTF